MPWKECHVMDGRRARSYQCSITQRPERIPSTRLAHRFAEPEGERPVVRVIEEPRSAALAQPRPSHPHRGMRLKKCTTGLCSVPPSTLVPLTQHLMRSSS
jgi:hypothetical protein